MSHKSHFTGLEDELHFKHPAEQFDWTVWVSKNLSGLMNFSKFREKNEDDVHEKRHSISGKRSMFNEFGFIQLYFIRDLI